MNSFEKAIPVFIFISTLLFTSINAQKVSDQAPESLFDSLMNSANQLISDLKIDESQKILDTIQSILRLDQTVTKDKIGDFYFLKGKAFLNKGQQDSAYLAFKKSLKIAEETEGKNSKKCADRINNMATSKFFQGKYSESLLLNKKALEIRTTIYDSSHISCANSYINIGQNNTRLGEFQKAKKAYFQSKRIFEKQDNYKNIQYGKLLFSIGNLFYYMNDLDNAKEQYLEAKNLFAQISENESVYYSIVLNNLSNVYLDQGSYNKAEPLLLESSRVRLSIFGKNHIKYANSLIALGNFHYLLNNYNKAINCFIETKLIFDSIPDINYDSYSTILNNIALTYENLNDFSNTVKYYNLAMDYSIKTVGKTSGEHAGICNNFGSYLLEQNKFLRAKQLLDTASNIWCNGIGKQASYNCSINTINQAKYYYYNDKLDLSISLFEEANKQFLETNGSYNVQYLSSLEILIPLYIQNGSINKAQKTIDLITSLADKQLKRAAFFLPEDELFSFSSSYEELSSAIIYFSKDLSDYQTAYNRAIFEKGFIQNSLISINKLLRSENKDNKKYSNIITLQEKLQKEYASINSNQKTIDSLNKQLNNYRKLLLPKDLDVEIFSDINWQIVQSKLNSQEAAIELVQYTSFEGWHSSDTLISGALILKNTGKPEFVFLGERKELSKTKTARIMPSNYNNKGVNISNLIAELDDVNTIYYAPAGIFHTINLSHIPIDNTEILFGEAYTIHKISSTRELAINTNKEYSVQNIVLFGDINYDIASSLTNNEPNPLTFSKESYWEILRTDSTLRGGTQTWANLPSTRKEIDFITSLLKGHGYFTSNQSELNATEESFKALTKTEDSPSPRIIHLATHGYFFPDPEPNEGNAFKASDHPLIRSGLIMAGANYAWKHGHPYKEGMEDGILTAYEISQMDLSDTELVVLSACETGLGEIKGNEGVYGLQRAFKIAGVENIIMSLWQVPDYQTKELMTRFYTNWLEKDMSINRALHAAQYSLRDEGYEPYYWAGFILLE